MIIIVSISLHFPTRKCSSATISSVPSSQFHKVTILKENGALVSHPMGNFIYRQLRAVQVTTLTPCTQLTTFTPYCVTSLWIRVSLPSSGFFLIQNHLDCGVFLLSPNCDSQEFTQKNDSNLLFKSTKHISLWFHRHLLKCLEHIMSKSIICLYTSPKRKMCEFYSLVPSLRPTET